MGTTRAGERILAAFGKIEAVPILFQAAVDVPAGGVLLALPALLALGLLRHAKEHFALPKGFYPLEAIFLVLSFLALARVKSLEQLRYEPPGEWGKVLGLDRAPEVKTLRAKLELICQQPVPVRQWSRTLAKEWMAADPEGAGVLYLDGHVRVYHGELTRLPRRYVARQKLCLRGITDYWVNSMDGQPFFAVSAPVDPGLIRTLEGEILPRLLEEVPGQPSAEQLAADPLRARFTIIFDREGYSPDLFKRLWEQRVAIHTYHKFPEGQWAQEEFVSRKVRLVNGQETEIDLAERGTRLSNGLWVREVRRRDADGHQTAMLSTDYRSELDRVSVAVLARWCQENFFQYMRQHYGLDRLIEYGTEPLPETTRVVNPAWRQADQAVRRERAQLTRLQAQFAALSLPSEASSQAIETFEHQKGQALERIERKTQELEALKAQRKEAPRHLELKDLPEEHRFEGLRATKKHFIDTIKLIAYRAETALVAIAREQMAREDDARALVRQLLANTVDLHPDAQAKTLTVRVHGLSTPAHDAVMAHLCEELTATEAIYPGTELRLIFQPVGPPQIPPGQES